MHFVLFTRLDCYSRLFKLIVVNPIDEGMNHYKILCFVWCVFTFVVATFFVAFKYGKSFIKLKTITQL